MATKKSNKQLWIMLALIAVIIAAILLLPSCGSRGGIVAARAGAYYYQISRLHFSASDMLQLY